MPLVNLLQHKTGGWLISVLSNVWRMLKKSGFKYIGTQILNQEPLEDTSGVICLH